MKKLPQVISQEEFERIFSASMKKKSKKAKQYSIAILLGFEAGMRISEIVGYFKNGETIVPQLTKENVNLESNNIKIVSGKGHKDRIVPLPKRFNKNALSMLPIKINRRSLQRWATNLGTKILDKHITFHTLRHGFATHYYNKTEDIRGLQVMLGHSRLDTTAIYSHVNPEKTINKARDVF